MLSCAFTLGLIVGDVVSAGKNKKETLVASSVPIADLIEEFESFARSIEGGSLSIEADAALRVLKEQAEKKLLLKAPEKKVKKPNTFPDGQEKIEWSDRACFEKEMKTAAGNDDESISIVCRWMKRYHFTQSWQTWVIESIKDAANREKLRELFEAQDKDE
jgi:hypothetical protein